MEQCRRTWERSSEGDRVGGEGGANANAKEGMGSVSLMSARTQGTEDITHANFAEPHVSALCTKVFHSVQGELTKVSRVFASTRDQGKGNIAVGGCVIGRWITTGYRLPLYSVNSCPWRHESEYPRYYIDKYVGCVVFVSSRSPQFV